MPSQRAYECKDGEPKKSNPGKGYTEADDAGRTIINDLNKKSLENKPISRGLAYGCLFFPGEAQSAKEFRPQLAETDTGKIYVPRFKL